MKKLINQKPEDPTDVAMDAAMDRVTQSALKDISSGSDVSSDSGKSGGSNTAIYVGVTLLFLVGGGVAYYFWRKNQATPVANS